MNVVLPAILCLLPVGAFAQVHVDGFVDVDYANNGDHPESRDNFFTGAGTTAHRADELALNIAAIEVAKDPKPFGYHITLVAGDSSDVVHAAEARHWTRYVYQASASYDLRGTTIEAGIYPSHIGFEGFFSKDNWNYTRGWLGEFSPYYQSGIKATHAWNAHWSSQVHLMRGWQNITAPAPRAIGTQVAFDDGHFSASFNTYLDARRKFGDLVAVYKATSKLSLGASLDRGRERPANWLGIAAYARYAVTPKTAVALRAERFRDPRAGISGFAQTVSEQTATLELRPSAHLIGKLEGRRDRSTAAVFNGSRNQTLAIASAVIVY